MTRPADRLARVGALAALLAAAVVIVALLALGSDGERYRVRAAFQSSVNVLPGLPVRVDGVEVGSVADIDYEDGLALLELELDDERVTPLHDGTHATLRFGTTIGLTLRFVDLEPGPRTARELPDGAHLGLAATTSAVEFDQLFNTFDRRTRAQLARMFDGMAGTFGGRVRQTRAALAQTPRGLDATAGLLRELGADRAALARLVADGHVATRTLAARQDDVRAVVSGAATTFDAFARREADIRASLDRFPGALRAIAQTLRRLRPTVGRLDDLVDRLAPGARRLPALASAARAALGGLDATNGLAQRTLATGTRTAPAITGLLAEGAPFLRALRPVLDGLPQPLACIRPYAPEIAGFLSTWSGFSKNYDGYDHYNRILNIASATAAHGTPLTARDFARLPGLRYALPRVPGDNGGQAWFQPDCGAGRDALDPAKDPEAPR